MKKKTKVPFTALTQSTFSNQRQDSLTDQMKTVLELATKAGCYDAADWLKRVFFKEDNYGR